MTILHNSLWQSLAWEQFQQACGNQTLRVHGILIIVRRSIFGRRFFEIPRIDLKTLSSNFFVELQEAAQKYNAVFSRIFPADEQESNLPKTLTIHSANVPEIFPEHTLFLDLQLSETELLAQMKPKGRYNISLAERKGVRVFPSTDVAAFYRLLTTTTARDGFSAHPQSVYEKMLTSFGENGLLLSAEYEGHIIAGGIFLFHEGVCTYYYGASSDEYRNVMAPYLLQWTAMMEAKKRGCKHYDFLGIAPEDAMPQHRLFGVSQFKEKFGGARQISAPAFEVVHKKWWYVFLKFLQKIRRLLP